MDDIETGVEELPIDGDPLLTTDNGEPDTVGVQSTNLNQLHDIKDKW